MPTPAPLPDGSVALRAGFVLLALLIAASFVIAVRRASPRHTIIAVVTTTAWLTVTAVAAHAGLLHFSPPPTMALVLLVAVAGAVALGLSPLGRALALAIPIGVLVGFQAFRIVVELLLHRAYLDGLMPIQMSYSGRNFDIVTGITAIPVALWLVRHPSSPRITLAWNTLGVGLLANILVVALLSAPTPLRVFMNEPSNVWITRAPWVWLPAVMVVAAALGHVLVYRRLWLDSREPGRDAFGALIPSATSP